MINWNHFANFSESEFTCHCGCGRADMNSSFMLRLQRIRDRYRHPIKVTSGFRCPAYNIGVSRTGATGPHTTGRASDIQASGQSAFALTAIASFEGITGMGFKQHGAHEARFIHLDDLQGDLRPWIWTY